LIQIDCQKLSEEFQQLTCFIMAAGC